MSLEAARNRRHPPNYRWRLLGLVAIAVLTLPIRSCLGFVAARGRTTFRANPPLVASADSSKDNDGDGDTPSSSSSNPPEAFPVLKQIEGIDWEGTCRYANDELVPASFQLTGGIRFDLSSSTTNNETDDTTVRMKSFVVFPNGKNRDIEMRGHRSATERRSVRLDSTRGRGSIYTVISELEPDTILINEVDVATNQIVMTSSLNLVTDYTADSTVLQLIQVSHEVSSSSSNDKTNSIIEGHQVWRYLRKDAYQ